MTAHFGLDISDSSIKVAQTRLSEAGFELLSFGEIKSPAPISSQKSQDWQDIASAISRLISQAQIKTKNVYISIPNNYAYVVVVEMPVLSDKELKAALEFEAEQYIPVPLETVYMEHFVLYSPSKEIKGEKMQVLIVAAKKDLVDKVIRTCQDVGLIPVVLETALLSSLRSLNKQLGDNCLFVDIGDRSTDVSILQKGMLKQTSSVDIAGKSLTRAICQNLAMTEPEAEKYKKTYGFDESHLEGKLALAMKQPMLDIMNHIRKSIQFVKNYPDGQIDKIILSGGTSMMPHFTHYLIRELNIEVDLAEPFMSCINTNLDPSLLKTAPRFTSTIGVAVRD